jgi:hypothetical protein
MPTPLDDYRKAAQDKFGTLSKHIPHFVYWRLGNSLDTMIDYFANIERSTADDVAGTVITQGTNALKDTSGIWFDDFGWWTISTTRAAQQTFFSDTVRKQFADLSSQCWKLFHERAPYTWERHNPETYKDYGPAVGGGVWNEYWTGTPPIWTGPKDGDPTVGNLHGIQNTVTNAVYLISAQRRSEPAAKLAYEFFNDWLFLQAQPALWWRQDKGALIRERVSRFANVDPAPGFQDDWAWTGDLALVMGIFLNRIALGIDREVAVKLVTGLLVGARLSLIDSKGLLQPWTASGQVPAANVNEWADTPDYLTGTGVFWRYLLQAWKLNNSDLRKLIGSTDYKAFIRNNADVALKQETDLDKLSNQIAVLVAATVVLA